MRLSANAHPPYSPKCSTSSQNLGARPIHLASAPLLQPLSHPLTVLKRKDMSICLLWMSPWPHTSARPRLSDGRRGRHIHPSRAEPYLHSLDVLTQRLDRRLQRCTRWLCFRSSSQDARQRRCWSGFCLAQGPEKCNRPGSAHHQSHSPCPASSCWSGTSCSR